MVIVPVPPQFPQPLPSQSPQMEVMSCMAPRYDERFAGANHVDIRRAPSPRRCAHSATEIAAHFHSNGAECDPRPESNAGRTPRNPDQGSTDRFPADLRAAARRTRQRTRLRPLPAVPSTATSPGLGHRRPADLPPWQEIAAGTARCGGHRRSEQFRTGTPLITSTSSQDPICSDSPENAASAPRREFPAIGFDPAHRGRGGNPRDAKEPASTSVEAGSREIAAAANGTGGIRR